MRGERFRSTPEERSTKIRTASFETVLLSPVGISYRFPREIHDDIRNIKLYHCSVINIHGVVISDICPFLSCFIELAKTCHIHLNHGDVIDINFSVAVRIADHGAFTVNMSHGLDLHVKIKKPVIVDKNVQIIIEEAADIVNPAFQTSFSRLIATTVKLYSLFHLSHFPAPNAAEAV